MISNATKIQVNEIASNQNESNQVLLSDRVENVTARIQIDRLHPLNTSKTEVNEIQGKNQSSQSDSNVTTHLEACPSMPPNLNGPIEIDIEYEPIASIEERFRDYLLPGGWYKPRNCQPKDRVAIIIPYRDRANHLPIFLKNIHSLLMKQQADYGIFVVEQIQDDLFNRAALMNVGFLEAMKLSKWDCFIFHDVDLIPLDDRNLYRCPKQPRHMSVAIDTMDFKWVMNILLSYDEVCEVVMNCVIIL